MPFQQLVNTQPAPAVAGDFAGHNPRATVLAGPGGLVAGPGGLTVGRFCWITSSPADADGAPSVASNTGSGPIAGIVHRDQQALITTYLAESGMVVPQGFECVVHNAGDFWIKNEGSTQALPGQFAYASFANGAASFAAANQAGSASITASMAAATNSWSGFVNGNVLTVTGTGVTGFLAPGTTVTGTSAVGNIASGTTVVAQLSGSVAGGLGTYSLSIPEQICGTSGSTTTFTGTYGVLNVTAVASGTILVGGSVTGTAIPTGTVVTGLISGTGNTGTYFTNNNTVVGSTALTVGSNVQTRWIAMSAGNPGELVKISTTPLG